MKVLILNKKEEVTIKEYSDLIEIMNEILDPGFVALCAKHHKKLVLDPVKELIEDFE